MRDAGCGMRDAGCGMRDAGCGMRDAGCRMRDAGCGMRDIFTRGWCYGEAVEKEGAGLWWCVEYLHDDHVPRGVCWLRISGSNSPRQSVLSSHNGVGQIHIYTVNIRFFWQGNHQVYGHVQCTHGSGQPYSSHFIICFQRSERCVHALKAFKQGWPEPYICAVYDRAFDEIPARNTVRAPYIFMVLAKPI